MDKVEALFIRACKSYNSEYRVKRLYKMFYYSTYSDEAMCQILSKIVDKYSLMKINDFIDGFNPNSGWKYGADGDKYYTQVVKVFSSHIRLAPIKQLEGYILPAKWRKV